MSEWLKEHAWKAIPSARADAHRTPPTQFSSTTSRNNGVHRRVPVNDGVCPGFPAVCDTVLTQKPCALGTCTRLSRGILSLAPNTANNTSLRLLS